MKKEKNKKVSILVGVLIVAIGFVVMEVLGLPAIEKYQTYQKAEQLLQNGNYEEAKTIFWSLGEYRNAEEKKRACDYGMAGQCMKKKDYESAKIIYEELGDYSDTKEKMKECNYQMAEQYRKEKSYEEAVKFYETLGKYKNSEQKLFHCKNGIAHDYFEDGEYQEAYEIYKDLAKANYEGAKESCQVALQEAAQEEYEEKISQAETEAEEEVMVRHGFCDITGDEIDELFLESNSNSGDMAIEVYTYKDGEITEMGGIKDFYSAIYYSKKGKIIFADMESCGCENVEIFRYQNGKIENVATIHASSYEYLKEDLPKGKFKEDDWIYCYTETNKDTRYYKKEEFESVFQKQYKTSYTDFWEHEEKIWSSSDYLNDY